MPVYICKDCMIGEKRPCTWDVLYTEGYKPVSCPFGKCGEDAEWVAAEELGVSTLQTTNSSKLPADCASCGLRFICQGSQLRNTLACRGARSQLRAS